jgi:optic atrophy 3 protein
LLYSTNNKVYHKFDITVRMRILGLGSPDKVPPLTEKAAIELGSDILGEFFVFGTAAAAILLEYIRQSSNKEKKELSIVNKVHELESEFKTLINKLETNNQRISELTKYAQDQKSKVDDLNGKIAKLTSEKNKKFATQAAQTSNGRQIGKVIMPRTSNKLADEDVTNSIIYQVANYAANELNFFKKSTGDSQEQSQQKPAEK